MSAADRVEHKQNLMTRRAALRRIGATAAAATAAGAGVPMAAGATIDSELDFGSDLVQRPRMTGSVTVAETDLVDMAELDFIDDAGDIASLGAMGVIKKPRRALTDPDPVEGDVLNPVTVNPSNFSLGLYTDFPRDTYTDADDVVQDFTWTDSSFYTVDTNVSLTEGESDANGAILTYEAAGIADATTEGATFDGGSQSADWDGVGLEDRNHFQICLDIDNLSANVGEIAFVIQDSSGNTIKYVIDSAATESNEDVIATATASGLVYQSALGDHPNIANISDIDQVKVEFTASGGSIGATDASITVYGLDFENPSEWEYGVEQFSDADGELDTQTITEPEGDVTIQGLDTLAGAFAEATIADVKYDMWLTAEQLDVEQVDWEFTDPGRHGTSDLSERFRSVYSLEAESHFDLGWTLSELVDDVLHPSGRYVEVGFATGEEDFASLADIDDDDVTLTARTSDYEDAAVDDEVSLTTSVAAGEVEVVFIDHLATESERDDMTADAGATAGPPGEPTSLLDHLMGLPGVAIASVLGFLGLRRFGFFGG